MDRKQRMVPQHTRPSIAHHVSNPIAHLCPITVNFTIGAGGFPLLEWAPAQAFHSVRMDHLAVVAQPCVWVMMIPAIQLDHCSNGAHFSVNARTKGLLHK